MVLLPTGLLGLVVWGWVAGVRSPGRDATLLLLGRGPADGADIYYRHGDEYEPGDTERHTSARSSSCRGYGPIVLVGR